MLTKVISGGQTGVDQAALVAARSAGIPTGGYAPKNFRTLDGDNPGLARFALVQTSSRSYALRTDLNVRYSDATLRIAQIFNSAGEKETRRAIRLWKKPSLDVRRDAISDRSAEAYAQALAAVLDFLRANSVRTLNVAGNSERTSPKIFEVAVPFLVDLFTIAKDMEAPPPSTALPH